MLYFVAFVVLAVFIWKAGSHLTREVDELAEETGLGRGFLGVFLLGLITSLPELLSTLTAGALKNWDLGLGNIYGSNVFNISMLIWADLANRRVSDSLSYSISRQSLVSALGALVMISMLSLGLYLYNNGYGFPLAGMPAMDWIVLFSYFAIGVGMWSAEKANGEGEGEGEEKEGLNRDRLLRIGLLSLAVVVAGVAIAVVCDRISQIPIAGVPLGGTLVGGILLGMATSLPEFTVSISAVRLGAVDMAVGNVFGSNMFNVVIIPVVDLLIPGTMLAGSLEHLFSYGVIVLMTSIFVLFALMRQVKKVGPLSPASYLLGIIYLLWAVCLYVLR